MENRVAIKSIDDDTVVVQGWGVIYGGEDLYGETFTPETDFDLDLVPVKRVYYDHRLGDVRHDVGFTKSVATRDDGSIAGIWIEAQLDRSKAYVEEIIELIKNGVLGWSSGSVPHLVDRQGKTIKSWPIVEFSLTPEPAEPRTLGVEQIKELAKSNPRLEALLPKGAIAASGAGAMPNDGDKQENKTNSETKEMSEEITYTEAELQAAVKNATSKAERQAAEQAVADYKAQQEAEAEEARIREEQIQAEVKARLEDEEALEDLGFVKRAPSLSKTGLGDNPTKAYAHWVRTGDEAAIKAANDTDMNVGTAADGGNAVPTGHFQGIIARRDETSLPARLGVREIPGIGTTVNVPIDNEADGEFDSTAEAASFVRDAPALDQIAMTLTKYTKRVQLSYELLQDEDSRLMAFLEDFVGRGLAKTDNNLLLTAVASSGTSLKTFASKSSIAAGEVEDIVKNNDLSEYLMDENSVAFVMRNSTLWDIKKLRTSSGRAYAVGGDPLTERQLLGYPVFTSQKAAAPASSAKSVYFGNWNFVGRRQAPGLTVLRDPYSRAAFGQTVLHYYYRTVFAVLQPEAIGYGAHPSS